MIQQALEIWCSQKIDPDLVEIKIYGASLACQSDGWVKNLCKFIKKFILMTEGFVLK